MLEDKFISLSVAFAKWLACRYTTEQLTLLAAFLMSVGDNIGIITAARDLCESQQSKESPSSNSSSGTTDNSGAVTADSSGAAAAGTKTNSRTGA